MEIKKIKLVNGGYKGLEVSYLKPEIKNGKTFITEMIEKRKHPIHMDLEKVFKDLRYHLIEIFGIIRGDMEKMDIDYLISECDFTGIKIDGTSFELYGTKKSIGNKDLVLNTQLITEDDGYHHYDTVCKMIETIIEETHQYLAGTKVVSNEEVAIRFITSGKDKSEEATKYDAMSMEEKKEYHTKVLEKLFGSVVLHNEDMNMEDIEDTENLLDMNAPIAKDENAIEFTLDADEIVIPLPAK